jgi:hypothetical protein
VFFARKNFTRVLISLAGLKPPSSFTSATLASCGSLTVKACAARQPHNVAPLNVSADNLTLTLRSPTASSRVK